mmetsp:Transcript_91825/g.159280  ORF Transcript_91825/g.159280 Transcript_91825/m.159280 type:complete len:111 (-) Transcript_91825:1640-1972(-)
MDSGTGCFTYKMVHHVTTEQCSNSLVSSWGASIKLFAIICVMMDSECKCAANRRVQPTQSSSNCLQAAFVDSCECTVHTLAQSGCNCNVVSPSQGAQIILRKSIRPTFAK